MATVGDFLPGRGTFQLPGWKRSNGVKPIAGTLRVGWLTWARGVATGEVADLILRGLDGK